MIERTLTAMGLFLVAVLVVAGVLAGPLASAFLATPALNGLILGVLVIGIVLVLRDTNRLRPAMAWLAARRNGAADPTAEPPRLLAAVARLGDTNRRLVLTPLAARSLVDGIAARLDESRELTRYLTGLLIFLGLLGTFWGLLQTIDSVADVVGGLNLGGDDATESFAMLQEGLERPLAAMATAFGSSLFGLGGSLVLGFLDVQQGQAQNRFFTELEDWLASATRLTGDSGEDTPASQSALPYLAALVERLGDTVDDLKRSLDRGLANRGEADAVRGLASRLDQAIADGRLGIDAASRQHLRNIEMYLGQAVDRLDAGGSNGIDELRGEIRLLARTLAHVAERGALAPRPTPPIPPVPPGTDRP